MRSDKRSHARPLRRKTDARPAAPLRHPVIALMIKVKILGSATPYGNEWTWSASKQIGVNKLPRVVSPPSDYSEGFGDAAPRPGDTNHRISVCRLRKQLYRQYEPSCRRCASHRGRRRCTSPESTAGSRRTWGSRRLCTLQQCTTTQQWWQSETELLVSKPHDAEIFGRPGARFTKYLTTVLRLSYDDAKVTIDLRRTSSLQDILQWMECFS